MTFFFFFKNKWSQQIVIELTVFSLGVKKVAFQIVHRLPKNCVCHLCYCKYFLIFLVLLDSKLRTPLTPFEIVLTD